MITIDFNNITDEIVYQLFDVEGKEADALNDIYLELFDLLGRDGMLKLFKHYRGDKIDCPMRLYRPEFIAEGWSFEDIEEIIYYGEVCEDEVVFERVGVNK